METILITGETDLLGSDLVAYLKKMGYKVIAHSLTIKADFLIDLNNQARLYEFLILFNLIHLIS